MTSEAIMAIGIVGGLMTAFAFTLGYVSIIAGENLAR